jgi:heme A synthase
VDILIHDIWFGLRTLRRDPGFAVPVVVTLAVGLGATTAIFSVVVALPPT